jgi:hypothetical protein
VIAVLVMRLAGERAGTHPQALAQGCRRRQLRLLLHEGHPQTVTALQSAIVERCETGYHAQQRGLAGAITPDQAQPLAAAYRELYAIQQRAVAVGEVGIQDGDEGHTRDCADRKRRCKAPHCSRTICRARGLLPPLTYGTVSGQGAPG